MLVDRLFKYKWQDYYPEKYYHCELNLKVAYFNKGDKFEFIQIDHKAGTITFSPYKKEGQSVKDYVFNLHYSTGACLSDS